MVTELARSIIHFYDRLLQYSMVGFLGTAAHWILFSLLIQNGNDQVVLASAMGFSFGAIVNYFLNYYLTFRSEKRHVESAITFGFVALLLLGINIFLMYLSSSVFMMGPFFSQALATGIILPFGYMVNKRLTF
ncbi:MAG TPA: GtrA family protein [Desulfobulbaceae bacterium]|nr:GtrA family protein [Desulfobulbaceae bacterium]